ncbi:MAG: TIGR02302 family protein [Pseudomonadota bacterium]
MASDKSRFKEKYSPSTMTYADKALVGLRRPLWLTRAGLVAERVVRAFWPFWTLLLAVCAALFFGLHETIGPDAVLALAILMGLGLVAALIVGVRKFHWPRRAEALDRLDQTLPGRPIAAVLDDQAIGAGDAASENVWRAHVARMADRIAGAVPVPPNLRLADRDRYGLRYMALILFASSLVFGSVWRATTLTEAGTGGSAAALAGGPSWEGWIEPPIYTGLPSLYLNDLDQGSIDLVEGTRITIRLYGEVGALGVSESVSGAAPREAPLEDPAQDFEIAQSGSISIEGPGGRAWDIGLINDVVPTIELVGDPERSVDGEMRQTFTATDDHGVVAGRAEIEIDIDAADRRFGLEVAPEPREDIALDLPLPFTGDRTDFTEDLIENLSEHPWASLPVEITLFAEDAVGQEGASAPETITLPGKRFFDPMAKTVIENRRDILWNRENGARTALVLRAVTNRPDGFVRNESAYLKLRTVIRDLETAVANDWTPERRDEIAQVLWDLALEFEYGNLSDARERLERAQDRLSEAIENGASDEEIAELMQELREAMQEYMRELAQNADPQNQQNAQNQQNTQTMTQDELQEMLDELQRLMEEGRMAEAQQLLDQLRQMMENMQVAQGQNGQGQQNPGQEAMRGLQETLREQQGLSDEAFRDLQEQFNPDAQAGQSGENQGRSGGQGRGEQHDGQGQGQAQNGEGGGGQPGQGQQQPDAGTLADRQQALRDQLERQRGNLPGAGTPEGDAARESLGRAGEAMDRAEDSLREDDLAGALDNQSEAMDALREGMRNLGEALAQQQQQQQGGQGQQATQNNPLGQRDPLGRDNLNGSAIDPSNETLGNTEVYRRAQELLDEIRRRSGEQDRPQQELDYLKRLLDRF